MNILFKKKIVTLVLISFCFLQKSIASDTLYFAGYIKIKNAKDYKYNIRFTVDKYKNITGYSLSDPGGESEVKTKITGTFDSITNILKYEETNVIRSKVDLKKNDLCFVKATLKIKKNKFFETFEGDFVGVEPGKETPCATGVINIQNAKRISATLAMVAEKDSVKKLVKDYRKEKRDFRKDTDIKITDTKGKEFIVTGDIVKLTLWDKGKVDGDMISIKLNDKYILEKYTLTKEIKIIEIKLSGNDVDVLKIVALNEGTLPPNTAAVKIETAIEQYPILTEAKMNEERTIYLKRKK